MPRRIAPLLLLAALSLANCGRGRPSPSPEQPPWSTGFWFWQGSSAAVTASAPVDVLYVQVGDVHHGNYPSRTAPPAREYWLVYRSNQSGLPSAEESRRLQAAIREALDWAKRKGWRVAGVQLDIDSPTSQLKEYAAYLAEFRKGLPRETQLSITALLDWFRPGTAIAEVVRPLDEFVPQFYDTGDVAQRAIAAPVDGAKWGPRFERLGKRYRIGISNFGRLTFPPKQPGTTGIMIGSEWTLLDAARQPAFRLTASETPAKERVLHYTVAAGVKAGWREFEPGDQLTFTFPTMESMAAAVAGAKSMGPLCAGVVFFRWPSFQESMAVQPDQALRAAGINTGPEQGTLRIHAQDGGCAAVRCANLYLTNTEPLSSHSLRYVIRSSSALEYFVPFENTPAVMSSPTTIELKLPPFAGRSRFYLGTAISGKPAEYRVEVAQ